VIIGAGEIGYELAGVLSSESHDVTVLDKESTTLERLKSNHDVLTQVGNATSAEDLVSAGVSTCDILIAVTSVDEVNMIASMMAKRLGAQKVIARVRNDEFTRPNTPLKPTDLGIDVMIHPELSAAEEIVLLIKRAAASDVVNLADGRMQIIGIRLDKLSPLNGKSMAEYASEYAQQFTFRVVAIVRRGRTIMPSGHIRLQPYDQIFILARTEEIPGLIKTTGKPEREIEKIMIAGGTPVGRMVAKLLSKENEKWQIKLIEPLEKDATACANDLKDVLVLNANPTDPDFLAQEGIIETDAFISVTDDEESNIITCLIAKHLNVHKTVALVSKPDYVPLIQTIGLDAAINKKSAATNAIHRFVRQGELISVTSLVGIKAEVVELEAAKGSKVTEKAVAQLKLPAGCIIGGILDSTGKLEIAVGNSIIHAGDRVILFVLPEAISQIMHLFSAH
jgi:trk system potassium uptake protein TrkA